MSIDDVIKWLPIVISAASLIITYFGHRLKQNESSMVANNSKIDQMMKFNKDMRDELDRKDKVIVEKDKQLADKDAHIITLEVQIKKLQTDLIDCLTAKR